MTCLCECYNVMKMKRLLIAFLALAVFVPTLMCGMSLCASHAQAKTPLPCHEKNDGGEPKAPMFMQDCMNIDLQTVNDNDVFVLNSNHKIDDIVYALAEDVLYSSFDSVNQNNIRGPPDPDYIRSAPPSLIMSTQRFRI